MSLFRIIQTVAIVAIACGVAACSETVNLGLVMDAGTGGCDPAGTQCNDCEDNDNDGKVDGFDPECTSGLDDDEGSFSTGIPGDNGNRIRQDCFFDGNSGSGDDGCDVHICCVLDLMGGACPDDLQPQAYDPTMCEPSDECIASCSNLVPPGCDCFGCCTVCDGPDCVDIVINPAIAPACDDTLLSDPDACPRCVKSATCTSPCDPANCIACPGQTIDDLPPGCTATCPANSSPCSVANACDVGEFCANGCCIGIPE